ncbi:hypothetical protein CSBG_00691 [Clostridium sp. 7_2_43FAA]|uniref:hypothetical protein n=1 Tax=Clostridium TaxID=1485 RepID=UPI00019AFEBD|nr:MULTISPECIES: hypothetical protein [Clostridium]EEH97065.1 hypothetical protein CSBG_00691 [Clostridium sp. 7_2_43FAA]
MDNNKQIAISKIADILSSTNLIIPQVDIWEKIFNNAGLSENYQYRKYWLSTKQEEINWRIEYYHNDKCYSALNEILWHLQQDQSKFLSLVNSIIDKINIPNIFDVDIDKKINKRNTYGFGNIFDIEEYLNKKSILDKNIILKNYPSEEFKLLRSNINMLNLDIVFTNDGLSVIPFTNRIVESSFDDSILIKWLDDNYLDIKKSYTDAIKAYSNGDQVGCITHCRNVITGIFTINKQEQRKWKDGLKKACEKDKNIINIDKIDDIPIMKYSENSPNINNRYQYPRYNLIYRVYTFCCALGAHANEGNITSTGVDCEVTDMEDAFMALRMTEDILIWLYQTNGISNS